MTFEHKRYYELSNDELYSILQLRTEVFVVEQNCVYQDMDNKDQTSLHVMCKNEEGKIVAYTRVMPEGVSYSGYCSIGRIVNAKPVRGQQIGKQIINYSIDLCTTLYKDTPIKISAQQYLLKYYNSLGFVEEGEGYLEDNIPHIAMTYKR